MVICYSSRRKLIYILKMISLHSDRSLAHHPKLTFLSYNELLKWISWLPLLILPQPSIHSSAYSFLSHPYRYGFYNLLVIITHCQVQWKPSSHILLKSLHDFIERGEGAGFDCHTNTPVLKPTAPARPLPWLQAITFTASCTFPYRLPLGALNSSCSKQNSFPFAWPSTRQKAS